MIMERVYTSKKEIPTLECVESAVNKVIDDCMGDKFDMNYNNTLKELIIVYEYREKSSVGQPVSIVEFINKESGDIQFEVAIAKVEKEFRCALDFKKREDYELYAFKFIGNKLYKRIGQDLVFISESEDSKVLTNVISISLGGLYNEYR